MSKIDDLHTLVRLLKEFEFPVSPILEYAIQEKIEELTVNGKNQITPSILDIKDIDAKRDMTLKPITASKKKPSVLRILRSDNTVIECEKAPSTFTQAIKEIGVEKVYALKIPMDNMHLITIGGNTQYPTGQHDVGNGYFVNVHSNTATKKRQLERIFKALNLNWKVEIIESK